MIIHNSHRIINLKEIHICNYKLKRAPLFCTLLFFFSFFLNAQDSIVLNASIAEKKTLEFEQFFFDAITEKAINNYKKAIEKLEECNSIIPNNKAVLFELSKNYFSLNKITEALEYGNQALELDKGNIWILKHLVATHRKGRNFSSAIDFQKMVATINPKEQRALVYLHLQNNDRKSAENLLDKLAEAKLLDARLRSLRSKIMDNDKTPKIAENKTKRNQSLKSRFNKEKSYPVLVELLSKLDQQNDTELLPFSEKGITLFPAQPLMYLINGKALNKYKQYKKAIESLQNGIDFVIDDSKLEHLFYNELLKAYTALKDTKNINKYQKKLSKT